MSVYSRCETCDGAGYFRCKDCICKTCQAKAKVRCSNCDSGKLACGLCGSTGEVSKKGLIFTRQEQCPSCRGAKRVRCGVCSGSALVNCPSCGGKGRNSTCSRCNATQKIKCTNCSGTGKLEGEWSKSLKNLPVDRLQFEHQKRQQKVQTLYMEVSRFSRELEEDYEEERLHRQRDPSFFRDAGPTTFVNEGAIERTQAQIRGLEEEMEAIEKVLGAKWK